MNKVISYDNERRRLEQELESLRRSFKSFKSFKKQGISDFSRRILMMQEIKKRGEKVKEQLNNLPAYKKLRDDEEVATDIMELLLWLSDQININKNMSGEQITSCAQMIMAEYPGLYLEELALVLKKGLVGDYGQVYDRLDTNTILGWIKKYHDEKTKELMDRHRSKHESMKPDPTAKRTNASLRIGTLNPIEQLKK